MDQNKAQQKEVKETQFTVGEIRTIYMGVSIVIEDCVAGATNPQFNEEARKMSREIGATAFSAAKKLEAASGIPFEHLPPFVEGDEKEFINPKPTQNDTGNIGEKTSG